MYGIAYLVLSVWSLQVFDIQTRARKLFQLYHIINKSSYTISRAGRNIIPIYNQARSLHSESGKAKTQHCTPRLREMQRPLPSVDNPYQILMFQNWWSPDNSNNQSNSHITSKDQSACKQQWQLHPWPVVWLMVEQDHSLRCVGVGLAHAHNKM